MKAILEGIKTDLNSASATVTSLQTSLTKIAAAIDGLIAALSTSENPPTPVPLPDPTPVPEPTPVPLNDVYFGPMKGVSKENGGA